MKGLVSKRTAELEAKNKFLQGTLQNNSAVSTLNQTTSTTLLNLSNTMRHKSPFQIVQPKNSASNGLASSPSLLRGSTSNGSLTTLPSKPSSPFTSHRPTLNLPEQPIYQNHQVPFQQQHQQLKQHQLQQQQQLLQQQQLQQQQLTQTPVQVLYDKASGYKSQIENKVKIMNQTTYMSNMHVRVPSQDSSIYSDTKTYIDVGQPIAIASRKGNVLLNPSPSQFGHPGTSRGPSKPQTNIPAIPRSQEVKKYMEPSFSAVLKPSSNQAIYANYDFRSSDGGSSQTEDEIGYTSPPSPVSSSYSELRVATRAPIGYQAQMNPQALSYDPLYEPISGQSSVSQYKPTYNIGGSTTHSDDIFGSCSKCLELIVGEGTGCMARNQLFHIKCFTCHKCDCQLQGQPFYPLDGKPYCKADYFNTLEKCCKCMEPILNRILRATGKPYHPTCFTCIMCNKSLDGVPFTVDASNEIHCIEDFHKRFAPKCSVCRNPIMAQDGQPEVCRVVALDRSFHVHCFKCEDCGLLLNSEAEGRGCYPLDDHVLCKACNTKRIQLLTQDIQ